LKIFLVAAGALILLVAFAALAALLFLNVDAYRPRVESAASDVSGMEVAVEGRLHIGFFPGLHMTLQGVRVRNRGTQVAFFEEADIAIGLLSLLRNELRYGDITFKRARISIERRRDGTYNYEKPRAAEALFPGLDLQKVTFRELDVVYVDEGGGASLRLGNCHGELDRMRHPGSAKFLAKLSLSGRVACAGFSQKDVAVSDLAFSLEATDGVFDFKPVTMRAFGGEGSGTLRVDHSGAIPVLHLDYVLKKFRIEEYFKGKALGKSVRGAMDFSIKLSMRGRTRDELRRSADGEMSLSGANLMLAGVDLDKELSEYEASQKFNLFDLTAFVFAGPLGLAVTKGAEFATLVHGEGGSTQIRNVVSKWKVAKGVAHAADVAMTTSHNRLALQGGLDFVNDDFDDVVVALVDSNGCAKVRQKIHGSFGNPAVENPGVLASITGPVRSLLRKIPGAAAKCEVFYSGSLAPPA
jgi:AsmA protein